MGRRGPKPTPKAILKARGSSRASGNKLAPEPRAGVPACPTWLNAAAKGVWEQVIGVIAAGVLTVDCGPALGRYCDALVRWTAAAAWLDENGGVYEVQDNQGNVKHVAHPVSRVYFDLHGMLRDLEDRFGLTPSARTRIEVIGPPPAAANPKKRFFDRGKDVRG